MRPARVWLRCCLAAAVVTALGTAPHAQMPDVRQMSGIPMPSADVPPGTIVVRVIRGDLSNNVANQKVELHVGAQTTTALTDASGRATFSNVPSGSAAHAIATVDGERLETSPIELLPTGGMRVMLVAGVGASAAPAGAATMPAPAPSGPGAPAVAGEVVFGGQSRIQIEFDDDQVEVFYILEVVNRGTAPINPKNELIITLPDDAQSAAILEGSSTQAQVRGRVVSVTGPFAPGSTPVQVAFGLAGGAPSRTLVQVFPAVWEQVQVIVSKVGTVASSSEQFASNAVMPSEGHNFFLGSGPALAAGKELRVSLTGLPARSRAGLWLALLAGALVLGAGAWGAYGGQRISAADARRAQLEARRQKLMGDLARLEQQRQTGGENDRLLTRRQDLLSQLERVYGELDQHARPSGRA